MSNEEIIEEILSEAHRLNLHNEVFDFLKKKSKNPTLRDYEKALEFLKLESRFSNPIINS